MPGASSSNKPVGCSAAMLPDRVDTTGASMFTPIPHTAKNVLARCDKFGQDTSELVITYHDVVWPFESSTGTSHLAKCPQGAQGAGNGQGGQGLARDFGTDEDG